MRMYEPRILLIGNFLSATTGIRSIGEELGSLLSRSGHKVITTSNKIGKISRLIDMIATVIKERLSFDVAYVEVYSDLAFITAFFCGYFLQALKKPYALTLHGGGLPQFAQRHPGLMRRLLRSATAVTSPSRYLIDTFKSIRPDIRNIPNGIELGDYPFVLRRNPRPHLIWLRAFHRIYCPTLPVQVLHELQKKYPEAKLTMIGPDKGDGTLQEAKALAFDLGLNDAVTFIEAIPKNKVGKYLNQGEIFLNTTLLESFGVAVLEAAACGLCIVSTNVGELPLLWENGTDALLVPPNDATAMAKAVESILANPDFASQLSASARKKAELYDWSNILPKWEELFEETIALKK